MSSFVNTMTSLSVKQGKLGHVVFQLEIQVLIIKERILTVKFYKTFSFMFEYIWSVLCLNLVLSEYRFPNWISGGVHKSLRVILWCLWLRRKRRISDRRWNGVLSIEMCRCGSGRPGSSVRLGQGWQVYLELGAVGTFCPSTGEAEADQRVPDQEAK